MSRLDEIKARAEQVHWTSTSIEQAMARMASSAADVPWLISEVESLTAERDALQVGRDRDRVKGATAVLNEELRTSEQEARARRAEAEVERLTALVQSTEDKADDYLAEIESAHAERDALHKREECLANEVEWWKERFPCDGPCSDAPEENCSRHGRNPADLWRIIGEVAAERNALAAAHARESEKVWKVEEVMDDIEGSDPTTWERLRDALAGSDADTTDTQPTDQEEQ